jgi:cell fate regulator YaaT (PSP1 superfamily)
MKDYKKRNNKEIIEEVKPDAEQEEIRLPEMQLPDDIVIDDEETVATAEDLANFMKDRRKAQKEKKTVERENPEVEEYRSEESQLDPYLEPDPEIPWVKYEEPVYLSRGCRRKPECYKPIACNECQSCSKVTSTNWMAGIRQPTERPFDCVEVRFKNNHKEFYRLPDGLEVTEGDVVAVEGQPGHDVGIVSLSGELCRLQMLKHHINPASENIKRLFRRAKDVDIERWDESLHDERTALLRTRKIVAEMGLNMKVNDVEFQGDHSKAIFYYTADERVDFRVLIKLLAEEFHMRIEMKQIGVRQEAGKVGGLGTCGRELCCSTWLTTFKSVTTSSAKTQQILPNPQKLAGQCGKLKCCLNFEYEVYADALKKFPPAGQAIRFKKGLALYKKTDVFRGVMWYAYEGENDLIAVKAEDVKAIIEANQRQEYPEQLEDYQVELMSTSALAQESTNEEVEREIQRLAEGDNGVVDSQSPSPAPRGEGNGERRKGRNDRRDNNKRRPEGNDRRNEGGERRQEGREQRPEGSRKRPENGERKPEHKAEHNERRPEGGKRRNDDNHRRSSNRDRRG